MFKWLFRRRKTEADLAPEIETKADTGPETVHTENRPTKKEFGRIREKIVAPGPNETFEINYGPEYEPKPKHKVLAPNGVVFHSEWYSHPWLGPDGWLKQPPHFSLPKIERMVEKDRKAREKNKQVQGEAGKKVQE